MYITYMIGGLLGFFSVYIVCIIVASVLAYFMETGTAAWCVYGIGAILTLLSMIGKARYGGIPEMVLCMYVLLSIVGAFIISKCNDHY